MKINPQIISLIDEIRNDKIHGASQLARQAAQVLKAAAEHSQAKSIEQFQLEQREVGQELMSARPAMAPVFNIINQLLKTIPEEPAGMDLDFARQLIISKSGEAIDNSLKAVARIAGYSSELIADGDVIMTHSYSSTVIAALETASSKRRNIEVIVTRSGPGRTGERIAKELGHLGIPLTYIDDAAMGLYTSTASKVMVGSDRVCADGAVINGIGTYQLALAAERVGTHFYVLCETLKLDPRLSSRKVDLEEKETSEVIGPGRLPPEVTVKNPYFDITPLELVTGIVTENGLLTPQQVIGYMEKHSTS